MKKTADTHWEYIEALTRATMPAAGNTAADFTVDELIALIGFHYKSAFIHGWKHALEARSAEATAKTVYTVDPASIKLRSERCRAEAEAARRVLDADNSGEAGAKTKASKLIAKNRARAAAAQKEEK